MAKTEKVSRVGEDHMEIAYRARQKLKEENHKRHVMKLEMMRHAIKTQGTIRHVPDSIDPDETAPQA